MTTTEIAWLVTDHHRPPRMLHLYGCEHLTSNQPHYNPAWREPVADERYLRQCQHCDERAAKLTEGR